MQKGRCSSIPSSWDEMSRKPTYGEPRLDVLCSTCGAGGAVRLVSQSRNSLTGATTGDHHRASRRRRAAGERVVPAPSRLPCRDHGRRRRPGQRARGDRPFPRRARLGRPRSCSRDRRASARPPCGVRSSSTPVVARFPCCRAGRSRPKRNSRSRPSRTCSSRSRTRYCRSCPSRNGWRSRSR